VSLSVLCQKCGNTLNAPGGLVFGPPVDDYKVEKFHLCEDCYELLSEWLYAEKSRFPQPKAEVSEADISLEEERRLYELESKLKCPKCGSPMRLRQNKTNKTYFFGCSKFPSCKGTRQPDGSLTLKKPETTKFHSYSGLDDDDDGFEPPDDDDIPF